jgi:CBS domain-containing protein
MSVFGAVKFLIERKNSQIWSISPDATVFEAVQMMADKNIGAVLVMEGSALVGVISERDYTRKVVLYGKSSRQTLVREIMFSPVMTVTPRHTIDECMRIMTERRIRHLPVVENDAVLGIVSIGDLVNWIMSAQQATINHLETYISGKYPG